MIKGAVYLHSEGRKGTLDVVRYPTGLKTPPIDALPKVLQPCGVEPVASKKERS